MNENAMARLKHSTLFEDMGFLLARSRAVWIARDSFYFEKFGLRGRSYAVLSLAASGQNPTQRELADFLGLDASQIVALVDELERLGYVQRQSSPTDRRTNIIVATATGARLHDEARAAARAGEHQAGLSLDDDERATLVTLLQRVAFEPVTVDPSAPDDASRFR